MKIKNSIRQSKEGQMLLEQKRMILEKELEQYEQKVKQLKSQGKALLEDAYHTLKIANVEIGMEDMIDISDGVKTDRSIDIKYKTIMGVEIPSIVPEENKVHIHYGLYQTTTTVDEVILKFAQVKHYILDLAQLENTIFRLNKAIEKVRRRANALKEIIIPADEKMAKEIQEILEENEKEEFVRLKKLKHRQMF